MNPVASELRRKAADIRERIARLTDPLLRAELFQIVQEYEAIATTTESLSERCYRALGKMPMDIARRNLNPSR